MLDKMGSLPVRFSALFSAPAIFIVVSHVEHAHAALYWIAIFGAMLAFAVGMRLHAHAQGISPGNWAEHNMPG